LKINEIVKESDYEKQGLELLYKIYKVAGRYQEALFINVALGS
jgi:hypothetical protein